MWLLWIINGHPHPLLGVVFTGMTKDNFTNLGVDVALELAPKPLENALKKANLDQIVRNTDPTPITNMVQSSIGKVKLTTDYVVKKQLEENK